MVCKVKAKINPNLCIFFTIMAETTCDLYVESDISMLSPAFSSYYLSDKNQKSESDCEDCTTLKVISMAS